MSLCPEADRLRPSLPARHAPELVVYANELEEAVALDQWAVLDGTMPGLRESFERVRSYLHGQLDP